MGWKCHEEFTGDKQRNLPGKKDRDRERPGKLTVINEPIVPRSAGHLSAEISCCPESLKS